MGHRSTDLVPLWSLVCEHAEVGIQHEVYHVIGRAHVEAVTEPVNRQVGRCHGIKEKILQVLQGLGRREKFVCHVPIISTGVDRLGVSVYSSPTGTAKRPTSCLHKLLHVVINSHFKMCCLLFNLTGKLFC